MFRKKRNYNKLLNFITDNRKRGRSRFKILTTGDEIIIIPLNEKTEKMEGEQLRLRRN